MFVTLKNIVLLMFIFVYLHDCVSALRREFPICRSRDTCIRLTHCLPYMNLIKSLRKPLSRAAVLFLRKQECGFDGMYPMVCCFPSTTRRAQGNRFNYLEEFPTKAPPSYYVPAFHDPHSIAEEDREITYQPPKKPDFTPSDLSDYRSYNIQDTKFLPVADKASEGSSSLKSTTESAKTTTRIFRRKINSDYNIKKATVQPMQLAQSDEARNKRAEEMKKKIEAINNAFTHSAIDYFFVRRMDNEKNSKTER